MGVFASQRTEGHEEDCDSFLDELLLQLLAAASVKNKAVRFRTCQILGSIMDQLHEDADLSQVNTQVVMRTVRSACFLTQKPGMPFGYIGLNPTA